MASESPVVDWYKNRTILITGATGFVGKVLLMKLLMSCPEIKQIYVLIRRKRGEDPQRRLEELLSNSVFEKARQKHENLLDKVTAIAADVSAERNGLSDSDREMLKKNIEIVFNVAASVRFDDSLTKAIKTNTKSALDLVELAKEMPRLKVFVHVSTAFTNCNYFHIKEELPELTFDWRKMLDACDRFSESELSAYTSKILGSFPNTYIFTKKIAETIVYEHRDQLPVIIYRPAVVTSATREPESGWCDSFSSILVMTGTSLKGILRILLGKADTRVDFITVDACVNGMIVAAWNRSRHPLQPIDVPDYSFVYNSRTDNFTIGDMMSVSDDLEFNYPLSNTLWKAYCFAMVNKRAFQFWTILAHALPGYLIDLALLTLKKKPRLSRIYRKLYSTSLALGYFMTNSWQFDSANYAGLAGLLTEAEKDVFYTESFYGYNFSELVFNGYKGMRKLFGDPLEITEGAIEHALRMYWIDMACRVLLLLLFFRYMPFSWAFNVLINVVSLAL